MAKGQKISEKSLQNLRPVKKGEVRNPHGRPRKVKTIGDILRRVGAEKMPQKLVENAKKLWPEASNMTMLEAACRMAYVHALSGKGGAWAFDFIAERTEGKITQPIEVSPFAEIDLDKLNQLSRDEIRAALLGVTVEDLQKREKKKKSAAKLSTPSTDTTEKTDESK